MNATSGPTSPTLISVIAAKGDNSRTPVPASSDSSYSFEDLLDQHEGPSGKPDLKSAPPSINGASALFINPKTNTPQNPGNDLPKTPMVVPTSPASSSPTALMPTTTALPSATDLTTTPVQSILHQSTTPAQSSPAKAAAITPSTALPDATDDSSMLLRIALLASHAQQIIAPKTPDATTADPEKSIPPADESTKAISPAIPGASDLSTLMVQALIVAANAHQTAANSGISTTPQAATASTTAATTTITATTMSNNIPLLGLTKGTTVSPIKEKKSEPTRGEGSFIQGTPVSSSTDGITKSLLAQPQITISQLTGLQTLTPTTGNKNSSPNAFANSTSSIAGTANVEKGKAMNTDLSIPQLAAISNLGTQGTTLRQAPADVHILLSSNNDFQDALKQVMHVAQLSQTSESRTPMRVAIEIQTPPGAIVNVYVSRQNDQWRAQLSTNDPQALTWVQDKMNSIRSGDVGVEVKWLPPQMESSSSSNNSNFGWERGNQNQSQSNYQQPDERSQSQRQKRAAVEPELAAVGANDFMNTFSTVGEAA